MREQDITRIVRDIMRDFAVQTGLSPEGKAPRRYLWTDAFAVCNFLELYHQTEDRQFLQLAQRLIEQVHEILGKHRADDVRTGWISGLDAEAGRLHPTAGGLRIGKKRQERKPSEPFDEALEWDRDGQYFHYLTKWMHALNRASRATAAPVYNTWAIELAKRAHAAFIYSTLPASPKRMYWKMSIDLSYALVPSMGHHDPLDGFIIFSQLQAAADRYGGAGEVYLTTEIAEMTSLCKGKSWATDDPLGLGDLICNAFKVAQLIVSNGFPGTGLLESLLDAILPGLEFYRASGEIRRPADSRLAFRELGLSLGLHAAERLQVLVDLHPDHFRMKDRLHEKMTGILQYSPVAESIEAFWLESKMRELRTWKEHKDINMVMLATSLAPDAYLTL